jgi:hypothetical protein
MIWSILYQLFGGRSDGASLLVFSIQKNHTISARYMISIYTDLSILVKIGDQDIHGALLLA